ncbi:hypothetical protein TYRP_014107 [Tyrophagus putrescentiae]|nr:hypothetical protein TYRP_014107 [Tyrophagus putrescentiae]
MEADMSSAHIQIVPSQVHNTTSIAWRCGSKSAGLLNVNSITALLGANGTGKSTFLRLLAGQERHKSSTVYVNHNNRQSMIFIDGANSTTKLSNLTVRQTLQYCFHLANSCTQLSQMNGHIDRLLDDWAVDRGLLDQKACKLEDNDRLQLAVVLEFTTIKRRPIVLVLDHVFDYLSSYTATIMLKQLKAQIETNWYSLGAWFWSHIFLTMMTTILTPTSLVN